MDQKTDRAAHPSALRRALLIALWLNVGLAGSLMTAGFIGDSSGLIANALDNTSDAAVYAISYYATSRAERWKVRAAQLSGVMLLVLCVGVLADVVRRLLSGAEPVSSIMIIATVFSAIINVICLKLLQGSRRVDVNLRAARTFSMNDFLSNLGVLVAGILVAWLGRSWPDLLIGVAIALVVGKGGLDILSDARRTSAQNSLPNASASLHAPSETERPT